MDRQEEGRKGPLRKRSPLGLLQEIYIDDPWKSMICCILLNCTSRKQVDRVRDLFFERYPTPEEAAKADPDEMSEIIKDLGFRDRRTKTIIRFSSEWMTLGWVEPSELFGIGRYGQDSWEIFQKGNLDISPNDGVLNRYLEWARTSILP